MSIKEELLTLAQKTESLSNMDKTAHDLTLAVQSLAVYGKWLINFKGEANQDFNDVNEFLHEVSERAISSLQNAKASLPPSK